MLISVILPTIRGREEVFSRVRDAYLSQFYDGHAVELLTEHGHPTVGCAWQAGAERCRGDYIHLGNDDCLPAQGWHRPAVEAVERGFLPSPMVYAPDGYPQGLPVWGVVGDDWTPVSCCLIPFISRDQWTMIQPLFTGHYHTDNFITERAAAAGWPCCLRTGYAFTHFWAQAGRGAGMSEGERMVYDENAYRHAAEMVKAGTWDRPWPPGGRMAGRDYGMPGGR